MPILVGMASVRGGFRRGAPAVKPSCLPQLGITPLVEAPTVQRDEDTSTWDRLIHVAFYDTRKNPAIGTMRAAAKLFNSSGIFFHVILGNPQPVPGMRVTAMSMTQPIIKCLHRNLKQLSHGPGPAYLLKPLLAWIMPTAVRRVILLDTDVVVLRGLAPLWADFDRRPPLPVVPTASGHACARP